METTIVFFFGFIAFVAGGYGAFQTLRHVNYYPVQRLLFAAFSAWGGQIAVKAAFPELLGDPKLRAAITVGMAIVAAWGGWLVSKRNRTPASEDVTLSGRTLPLDLRTAERQLDTAVQLVESGRVTPYAWLERRRAAHRATKADAARRERWNGEERRGRDGREG